MCVPAIVQAVAIGVGAIASYQKTEAENRALDYNAQIAETNAGLSEKQATDIARIGAKNESDFRSNVESFKSTQKTSLASSGVKLGEGSAKDILESTTSQGEVDAMTMRYNTLKQIEAKNIETQNYLTQAKQSRASKGNPWMSAGTSLLTGASTMMMNYAPVKATAQ